MSRDFVVIFFKSNGIEVKLKCPDLVQVGQDDGENPDNTLIVSFKTDKDVVAKVKELLLDIGDDKSKEALAVRMSLKAEKFIPTTKEDFSHTLKLLGRAGVTKDFYFSY